MNKKYNKSFVYRPATKKEKPRRDHSSLFYITLIVVGVILALSYLVLQNRVASMNFEIEMAQKEADYLEKENRSLRLQLAEKTDLRKIERRAREELAMVRPQQQEFVVLDMQEFSPDGEKKERFAFNFNVEGLFDGLTEWFQKRATVAAGALGE